ncbi:GMC family oxidoreductase [bacterium]|nr:GMC family oxidoreductase [bacterium]
MRAGMLDGARGKVLKGDDLLGSGDLEISTEVVVIGTGAGGAACAATLAERGVEVLLLEEGGYFERKDFTASPLEMLRLLYRDFGLTTAIGVPGSPSFPIPMGRCVGGSTTINSGTCFRMPPRVLDHWMKDLGITNISQDGLEDLYARVERDIHVATPPLETIGRNGLLLHKGATELGLSSGVIPRNAKGCRGSGVCTLGCPTDAKQSTLLSYVPRALKAGAALLANVKAERILVERERARGVLASVIEHETGAVRRKVQVRAPIVVVACGTCMTPLLLHKSKIGNSSGQLGRNLHVHPASKIMALTGEVVRAWEGVPQSYYVDEWAEDGILIEGISLPPALGALALPGTGHEHGALMERYDHLASWGVMVSDTSHGRVRSGLGGRRPFMTYQLNQQDVRKIVLGLSRCAELAFAAGAELVHASIFGVPPLRSREDALRLGQNTKVKGEDLELMAFHPLGTARMGLQAKTSVVDSFLEVHDVDGLFVTDGSVFPTSLEVNPQLTIMAFALRTAEFIASRRDRYTKTA